MSDPFNHLESIWYHSEPLQVPYSPDQFLGWDFFSSISYSKPALRAYCSNMYIANVTSNICEQERLKSTVLVWKVKDTKVRTRTRRSCKSKLVKEIPYFRHYNPLLNINILRPQKINYLPNSLITIKSRVLTHLV
jgi:hypothetical protein